DPDLAQFAGGGAIGHARRRDASRPHRRAGPGRAGAHPAAASLYADAAGGGAADPCLISLWPPIRAAARVPDTLPRMRFHFEVLVTDPTGARLGRLSTPHGVIETPAFMPVGTAATVKGQTQTDLESLGVQILLANTYHLFLRPGHEAIRHMGGLHRFMSWPRAILTDSGGYQVFSLSGLRKITDDGVTFQSHLDGDKHVFTPESTVDVQLALGSDIMMVLDECPEYPVSHEYARVSMERTVAWARTGYAHYRRRTAETPAAQSLFPIVQGSMFPDLRRECTEQLVELEADGYAVGGLSVGDPRPLSLEMVEAAAPVLPGGQPRYAMGVGMPEELPEYVARGID